MRKTTKPKFDDKEKTKSTHNSEIQENKSKGYIDSYIEGTKNSDDTHGSRVAEKRTGLYVDMPEKIQLVKL